MQQYFQDKSCLGCTKHCVRPIFALQNGTYACISYCFALFLQLIIGKQMPNMTYGSF